MIAANQAKVMRIGIVRRKNKNGIPADPAFADSHAKTKGDQRKKASIQEVPPHDF
jgi:hypothetical protein